MTDFDLRAELGDGGAALFEPISIDIDQHNVGALRREHARGCVTDAAGAAGDDDFQSRKVFHFTFSRIRSAARSATALTGILVLPAITVGMTDASTTRNASMPLTRKVASTTSPIRQVPQAWCTVTNEFRICASICARPCASRPGEVSRPASGANGGADSIDRATSKPRTSTSMSPASARKLKSIFGLSCGSLLASVTLPRLAGRTFTNR